MIIQPWDPHFWNFPFLALVHTSLLHPSFFLFSISQRSKPEYSPQGSMAPGSHLLAWAPGCSSALSTSGFMGRCWVLPQPGVSLCLKARVDCLVPLCGGDVHQALLSFLGDLHPNHSGLQEAIKDYGESLSKRSSLPQFPAIDSLSLDRILDRSHFVFKTNSRQSLCKHNKYVVWMAALTPSRVQMG